MELTATIIQSLSIIIAAAAFVSGINAWKREHIGRRQIDLAEQVLSLFYESRDQIREIRNPISYFNEETTRKARADESEEETKALNRAHVVFARYEARKDTFIKLNTLKYQFMAVFGSDKEKHFLELNRILREIFKATHLLAARYWRPSAWADLDPQQHEKNQKQLFEKESIIWYGAEDPDPIETQINKLLKDVESDVEPIIKKGSQIMEGGSWLPTRYRSLHRKNRKPLI